MLRKLVSLLSLAAVGVGLFVIKATHAADAACVVPHGQASSFGMNSSCLAIVTSNFAGFAIVIIGCLAFVSTLAIMKKRRREQNDRRFSTP
jgi:hypothetical protein